MKKLLKFLLYTALVIVALVVLLGVFAKKDYHIERSIEIDAPQAMIYDYIRSFKNFDQWSPWMALDPEMTSSVSGTDGEVGASHTWKGNEKVGEGRQTITALAPDRIDIKTEFVEPFAGTSPTWFKLEPAGSKIKVSWAFDMHAPFSNSFVFEFYAVQCVPKSRIQFIRNLNGDVLSFQMKRPNHCTRVLE